MDNENLMSPIPDESDNSELTQEQVWDVLSFAQNYFNVGSFINIGANRTDLLSNGINSIDAMIQGSDSESEKLIEYSQKLELESQIYRKLISYLGNLLSFDFTYVSNAYDGKNDYNSLAYKKDLKIVENFFNRFDYKKEFINVTRHLLRNEVFYCVPRFEGNKIILQELPRQFCHITGKGEYCYRFAFDFSYFDSNQDALIGFPEYFTKTYNEIINDRDLKTKSRKKIERFIELPTEVAFVFKFNLETLSGVPVFSGLFKDLINQNLMRNLQKNSDMAAAQRLVIGQLGRNKDTQAKTGNNFDTDAKLLGQFMAFMKSALSDAIKLAALPLEEVQAISFPAEKDLYKDYLKTTLSTSGVNSNLLFADSDNRSNSVETQLSLNVDEQLMAKSIYPQAESFLELFVNQFTKKYLFTFKFEGSDFYTNRSQRLDAITKVMNYGILLPQKIASALSMSPFDFYHQIEEGYASGIAEKFTQMINVSKVGSADAGRPEKEDSELSDSGVSTRDSGGNIDRGGEV
jgi:hypothetical protein